MRPNLQAKKFKRAAQAELDRLGATVEPVFGSDWEPGDAALEIELPCGYGISGSNTLMASDYEDVIERLTGLDLELLPLDDYDESCPEYEIIRAAMEAGS